MKFSPKVSIVIPVYNGSNYLKEAIDSALAQTYKNIEVIVVNDGSNDGGQTEAIAKSYGDKIKYYFKENGGVASALNLGIEKMTGEYFSWLSHDDVYYSHKTAVQIRYLSTEKGNVILYSDYEVVNKDSKFLFEKKIGSIDLDKFLFSLINSYPVNGCTILIPKNCFNNVGLFDEQLYTTQDYNMWFRMAKEYRFKHIPKILIKSRIHDEQESKKIINHSDEKDQYYINCLNEININELQRMANKKSIATIYVMLAIKYKEHHCLAASNFAMTLCKKHLFQDRPLTIAMNILLISYCAIWKKWLSVHLWNNFLKKYLC